MSELRNEIAKALALLDARRPEAALVLLESLAPSVMDDSDKHTIFVCRFNAYLEVGNTEHAEQVLEELGRSSPSCSGDVDSRILLQHAEVRLLMARGEAKRALHKLHRLLREHPGITEDLRYRGLYDSIQKQRGFLLLDLGESNAALSDLEAAASTPSETREEEQEKETYLGACLYELGRNEEARVHFQKVLSLSLGNTREFEIRYRLACLEWQRGALAQAKLLLEQVLLCIDQPCEPRPHRKGIYELYSKVCQELGDVDSAKRYHDLSKRA